MSIFFFLLTLLFLLLLIIGLIKPGIFSRFIKSVPKRKNIAFLFISLAFASLIGIMLTASPVEKKEAQNSTPVAKPVQMVHENKNSDTIIEQATATEEVVNPVSTQIQLTPTALEESITTSRPQPTISAPQSGVSQPSISQPVPSVQYYSVTQVVDGDTFKASIDGKIEIIRLIGIDTPESVDPRRLVECFGIEASNRAKELLAGKSVRLEADSTQGDRDKYQRLLRYAWLESGTFFNKQMILDGYAMEYTYAIPYRYQTDFKQAEAEARNEKRGLWADGACIEEAPQDQATQAPATTSQPSGHTFYTSSHYSATFYYCDTDEAWKNLSPKYLKSFPSEAQLLATYKRELHEPCK